MSIAAGSTLVWSDITSLYSQLNAQRSRWGRGGGVSPSGGGVGATATASTANTFINFFNDLRNHGQAASYLTWQAQVSVGEVIYASKFATMRNQLNTIAGITPCSCFGFSFRDCSCNGFDFDDCYNCCDFSNDQSDMFKDW